MIAFKEQKKFGHKLLESQIGKLTSYGVVREGLFDTT